LVIAKYNALNAFAVRPGRTGRAGKADYKKLSGGLLEGIKGIFWYVKYYYGIETCFRIFFRKCLGN
jgi:hypothetical protein